MDKQNAAKDCKPSNPHSLSIDISILESDSIEIRPTKAITIPNSPKKTSEPYIITIITKKLFYSIITDLYVFNIWQVIALLLFCAFSIIFSFVDFNHFINPDDDPYTFTWYNDELNGVEYWKRVLKALSGAASFTGVMSVVLTTKGKYSSYFWGIINCILYGLFAFAYGYGGDAQLNIIFFLPFQFVGLYTWKDNMDNEDIAISRSLGWKMWIVTIISATALSAGFYFEIPPFTTAISGSYPYETNLPPRFLDSISNSFNIVGQVLLLYRFWEQWIFWILVDIMQIAMFSGIAGFGIDINIITMWCLFLINAFFGLYIWFVRMYTKQSIGVVIGKFYPLHKGHMYLINYALERCDVLYLILCTDTGQNPNGDIREKWLQKLYSLNKKIIIKRIDDINQIMFLLLKIMGFYILVF